MPVRKISRVQRNQIFNLAAASDPSDLANIAATRLTLALVCAVFALKEDYILGSSRGPKQLVLSRHLMQYLAHIVFGMTYTEVARLTLRDRTSVMHACARMEDKRDKRDFDKAVFFLELALMHMAQQTMEDAP